MRTPLFARSAHRGGAPADASVPPAAPEEAPEPAARPELLDRLPRPLRSALAGGAATLVDLAVLACLTGLLGVSPSAANLPSLLAGASVQFLGNRHFAFRAGSGSLAHQLPRFVAAEALTLALHALAFHALASNVELGTAGALLARALIGNLVFVAWTYPAFRVVFRASSSEAKA